MTIVPFRPGVRAVVGVDEHGPIHFESSEP